MHPKSLNVVFWICVALIVVASVGAAAVPPACRIGSGMCRQTEHATLQLPVFARLADELPTLIRDPNLIPVSPRDCTIDDAGIAVAREYADQTYVLIMLETGLLALIFIVRGVSRRDFKRRASRGPHIVSLALLAGFALLVIAAPYEVFLKAALLRISGCETYSSFGIPTSMLPIGNAGLFPLLFASLAAQIAVRIKRSLSA